MPKKIESNKANQDRKSFLIKVLIVILPLIIVGFIPTSEAFTPDIKLFFLITLTAILLWAVDIMNMIIIALMLPVAFVLSGLATSAEALAPWTQHLPYLVLGALIISKIFEKSGLMERLAYWFITKTGGSYLGIILALTGTGFVISLLVPGSLARIALLGGMTIGITKAMGFEAFSKETAGLMFAAYNGAINMSFSFITGTEPILVMNGQLEAVGKAPVSYMEYMFHNLPISIIMSLLVAAMIYFMFRPKTETKNPAYFKEKYAELGKVTSFEKKVAIYLLILVLLLMTSSLHKIDLGWIFIIVATAGFVPGISLGNNDTMKEVNYGIIFFIVGTMAIGQVSSITGAGNFIADMLLPLMSYGGKFYTVAATWVMAVLANFVLTPFAAAATLTVPLEDLASQINLNIYPMLYAFNNGLNQILLPYESTLPLMVYSFGIIKFKDFLKFYGAQMALNFLWLLVIALPYWMIIGLV